MGMYHYKAKRGPRDTVAGVLEAETRVSAIEKLSLQGLFPLDLREQQASSVGIWTFMNRISKKEVGFFTRQMADLLESNIPLPRALELTQEQSARGALAGLIQSVREDVQGGMAFSAALGKFPQVFSSLYLNLIVAGEAGELLSPTLNRLAAFMEQEDEFRSRLLAALAYPLLIAGVGSVTVIFLMLFVVPRLTAMFLDTGQGMPWMARVLSAVSDGMSSRPALAALFLLISAFVWLCIQRPQRLKSFVDNGLFKIPVWGSVVKKEMLARFSRTLAMLLTGGVPIVSAMRVVSDCMNHPLFGNEVRIIAGEVEQGQSLSWSLKRRTLFPVFVCQMIAIGEETNTLEKSLEKVAATYERETDRAMKLAISLLEPVMILGVGSVIGVIVIGMLLPIFEISAYVK